MAEKRHRLSLLLTRAELQKLHDLLDKPMMETTDPQTMQLCHRLRALCTSLLAVSGWLEDWMRKK